MRRLRDRPRVVLSLLHDTLHVTSVDTGDRRSRARSPATWMLCSRLPSRCAGCAPRLARATRRRRSACGMRVCPLAHRPDTRRGVHARAVVSACLGCDDCTLRMWDAARGARRVHAGMPRCCGCASGGRACRWSPSTQRLRWWPALQILSQSAQKQADPVNQQIQSDSACIRGLSLNQRDSSESAESVTEEKDLKMARKCEENVVFSKGFRRPETDQQCLKNATYSESLQLGFTSFSVLENAVEMAGKTSCIPRIFSL